MRWRKLNTILHRDIGYLSIGLTIIYAISGIAVNHVSDWNPSYNIETAQFLMPFSEDIGEEKYIAEVLAIIGPDIREEGRFRPRPGVLKIFFAGNTVQINFESGLISTEMVSRKPVLHSFNFLHLNHAKKMWTYIADLYAVALLTLAITGMFVLPGKKGIKGRGAWLTIIGAMIPLIYMILYTYI